MFNPPSNKHWPLSPSTSDATSTSPDSYLWRPAQYACRVRPSPHLPCSCFVAIKTGDGYTCEAFSQHHNTHTRSQSCMLVVVARICKRNSNWSTTKHCLSSVAAGIIRSKSILVALNYNCYIWCFISHCTTVFLKHVMCVCVCVQFL